MKNPSRDPGLFHVDIDFRNKEVYFTNQGGSITSSVDKLENHPIKGYPYKRDVKLFFEDGYKPYVEARGENALYDICIDVDEFTSTATVIPITNKFKGYLDAKDNQIKRKDKLKFNSDGQVEKDISIEFDITDKLYIVHVAVYDNKGKPN
ncbi:DUF228 domain-containing protein [Borrelia turicatae]|uniref:DUF228 domain-containing protein n=1 Tax=Borrelia turicatae TaxID=142 RepID=UPI002ED5B7C5